MQPAQIIRRKYAQRLRQAQLLLVRQCAAPIVTREESLHLEQKQRRRWFIHDRKGLRVGGEPAFFQCGQKRFKTCLLWVICLWTRRDEILEYVKFSRQSEG